MTTLQHAPYWPPAPSPDRLRLLGPCVGATHAELDLVLEEISAGRALFTTHTRAVDVDAGHLINAGVCSTLLDFTLAATIQSTLPAGAGYRVLEFRMNNLHSNFPIAGRLEAHGEIVRSGRRTVSAGGRVLDATGVMRASGSLVALIDEPDLSPA